MVKQKLKPLKKVDDTPEEESNEELEGTLKTPEEVEETEVETEVETEEEPAAKPAKKGKKKYWNTRVHIPGIGTVTGEATAEQIQAFKNFSGGHADVNKFLADKDVMAIAAKKKKAEARKRMGVA